MSSKKTLTALTAIQDTFGEHKFNDRQMMIYGLALRDIPDKALMEAILTHINSSPYVPKISELRELAGGTINDEWTRKHAPTEEKPDPMKTSWRLMHWWRDLGYSDEQFDAAVYVAERQARQTELMPGGPSEPWPEAEALAPHDLIAKLVLA